MNELYRHFDRKGALLYVGISLSTVARLAQHRTNSKWFGKIARVEIERFKTREALVSAERAAIQREQTLWNIAHTPRPRSLPTRKGPQQLALGIERPGVSETRGVRVEALYRELIRSGVVEIRRR